MNSLGRDFFDGKIDFDKTRVRPFGAMVSTENKVEVSRFGRIYRFLTFHKDSNLTAVNREIVKGLESGTLIENIATELLKQPSKFNDSKANVLENLTNLNEKFIKGNQNNFLSRMALKVVNAVRYVFRMDFIGYHELNTKDIADKLEAELARQLKAKDGDDFDAAMASDVLVPVPMVPLLESGSATVSALTVGDAVRGLPVDQQAAVKRLFDEGELAIANQQFQTMMGGTAYNINVGSSGNVALQLTEQELATLQRTLTGEVNNVSRLLVALLLVGAGDKAPLLLDAVRSGKVTTTTEAVKLLTEAKKDAKPEKTFLERITDSENPPVIKVGGNPCTIRLDTKKRAFIIDNKGDQPMYITVEGYFEDGRYYKILDTDKQKPRVLVQKGQPTTEEQIVELQVLKDYHYKIRCGNDTFDISLESLVGVKVEEVV